MKLVYLFDKKETFEQSTARFFECPNQYTGFKSSPDMALKDHKVLLGFNEGKNDKCSRKML